MKLVDTSSWIEFLIRRTPRRGCCRQTAGTKPEYFPLASVPRGGRSGEVDVVDDAGLAGFVEQADQCGAHEPAPRRLHCLQRTTSARNRKTSMNTSTRTTRFAGLLMAVLITATIQGTMLWQFDAVAHEATLAQAQTATLAAVGTGTDPS